MDAAALWRALSGMRGMQHLGVYGFSPTRVADLAMLPCTLAPLAALTHVGLGIEHEICVPGYPGGVALCAEFAGVPALRELWVCATADTGQSATAMPDMHTTLLGLTRLAVVSGRHVPFLKGLSADPSGMLRSRPSKAALRGEPAPDLRAMRLADMVAAPHALQSLELALPCTLPLWRGCEPAAPVDHLASIAGLFSCPE